MAQTGEKKTVQDLVSRETSPSEKTEWQNFVEQYFRSEQNELTHAHYDPLMRILNGVRS